MSSHRTVLTLQQIDRLCWVRSLLRPAHADMCALACLSCSEERTQFFDGVVLLIDRQPDDEARYEIMGLLAELAAIEKDMYRGGRAENTTDSYAFGSCRWSV